VYDRKAVRRRRAALAVFVALSIAILTAYFGESPSGFFHALQRGAQEVFAPIESGASRALKPARDFFGWAGDTIDAKDQNEALREEVERLRSELADLQTRRRDTRQVNGLVGLHSQDGFPRGTRPVTARVIARSPSVWYSSLKIDKGSSDGVKLNQAVIAAASDPSSDRAVGGLAGKVTRVTGGTAEVTLLTDASSGVAAQVMPAGAAGVVKPEVGNPRDLLLDFVEGGRRVTEGTIVVTSGFKASRVESLFPRGIPIGEVTKVDLDEVELYQRVHIRPFADFRRIDIVQVLTRRPQGTETAGVLLP
jgi:rod shape-determining protein MreC